MEVFPKCVGIIGFNNLRLVNKENNRRDIQLWLSTCSVFSSSKKWLSKLMGGVDKVAINHMLFSIFYFWTISRHNVYKGQIHANKNQYYQYYQYCNLILHDTKPDAPRDEAMHHPSLIAPCVNHSFWTTSNLAGNLFMTMVKEQFSKLWNCESPRKPIIIQPYQKIFSLHWCGQWKLEMEEDSKIEKRLGHFFYFGSETIFIGTAPCSH